MEVNWFDTVLLIEEGGRVAVNWFDTVVLFVEGVGLRLIGLIL